MTSPPRLTGGDLAAIVVSSDEVPNFYRPKEKSVRIQAYVAESFQRRLANLGRLWSILDRVSEESRRAEAKARGESPPKTVEEKIKDWTEAEVVKRLCEVSVDAAWSEIEGGEPRDEAEWSRLEQALLKRARTVSSK